MEHTRHVGAYETSSFKVLKDKANNFSKFKYCDFNDHISFNLGRGQSRDHISREYCQKENILHKTRQLEAKIL